ncbi:MAG: UbiA family prenyltransferase [Candidatus Aenigmarchaeota archaeon]|nr:UbiA family prenyltransferase [Candidatus Aenigmarchaeota archaeon]
MLDYIKILRPSVVLLTTFAVIVGALISGIYNINLIIVASIVAMLISGSGNVLNDYFDYDIDKINKPNRPLVSGSISKKNAIIYYLLLISLSIIFVLLLNIYCIVLAFFNIIFIFIYNKYLKRTVVGHFADSWLPASAIIFGGLLSKAISIPLIILAAMSYFGNLSREIAKGIEDYKGDKKLNIKTFSILLGKKYASISAIFFLLIAIIISPIPYLYGFFGLYYIIIVCISIFAFIVSIFYLFRNVSKAQKIMKIAMFIGLLAFLAGIIQ